MVRGGQCWSTKSDVLLTRRLPEYDNGAFRLADCRYSHPIVVM